MIFLASFIRLSQLRCYCYEPVAIEQKQPTSPLYPAGIFKSNLYCYSMQYSCEAKISRSIISGDFESDPVFGKAYLKGKNKDNPVKVNIYYASEIFFGKLIEIDGPALPQSKILLQ
jgi:hypothetical protein